MWAFQIKKNVDVLKIVLTHWSALGLFVIILTFYTNSMFSKGCNGISELINSNTAK